MSAVDFCKILPGGSLFPLSPSAFVVATATLTCELSFKAVVLVDDASLSKLDAAGNDVGVEKEGTPENVTLLLSPPARAIMPLKCGGRSAAAATADRS